MLLPGAVVEGVSLAGSDPAASLGAAPFSVGFASVAGAVTG